jgi:hypothetical protein
VLLELVKNITSLACLQVFAMGTQTTGQQTAYSFAAGNRQGWAGALFVVNSLNRE